MQQQQPSANYNPYAPPTTDIDQGLQLGHDDYVLADPGTRFAAWFVDGLLSGASFLPGVILGISYIGWSGISSGDVFTNTDEVAIIAVTAVVVLMGLAFHIFQWYLIATTGQSLAKRWLGIKIVRTDGSPAGFVNGVVLRSWIITMISNIPVVGGLLFIVDALMIFGAERRCMHDQIASTRVVLAQQA